MSIPGWFIAILAGFVIICLISNLVPYFLQKEKLKRRAKEEGITVKEVEWRIKKEREIRIEEEEVEREQRKEKWRKKPLGIRILKYILLIFGIVALFCIALILWVWVFWGIDPTA